MTDKKTHAIKAPEFLSGDGETASLMRSRDWGHTSLGPPENWPDSLKTVVRIMLDSRYAIWIGWGPELAFLYNDAYREMTLGKKHPGALGRPAEEVWAEVWPDLGPRVEEVVKHGKATYDEDLFLLLERSGFPEETYHTFSYSPLPDDNGNIGGLLCIVVEDTNRYIAERRLTVLRETGAQIANSRELDDLFAAIGRSVGANLYDLPFSLIYLIEPNGSRARLVSHTGIDPAHRAAPGIIRTGAANEPWPIGDVLARSEVVLIDDLAARFPDLPPGAWRESPHSAAAVPIRHQGQEKPAGVLIAGLNPYRPFNDNYRGFINLLAGQIAAGLADVRTYEEERKRAEALAEINRAKTTFFSNASHEFRTPLTLMLSPLEDLLGRDGNTGEVTARRDEIELIHRNGLRLLRLVNTLLDFSRIEAGRFEGVYEPTDLAAYTAELASTFRSAMDQAGLRYVIDCATLPEPAYVDRDMWEKIVLNLLSNAFKYTLEGEIGVSLRLSPGGKSAEFTVRDTGAGISAHEIPRLFERFHRIEGQIGRTHEGSGIGLALVQELVRLHGGNIRVDTAPGKGSAFTVVVPLGSAHLRPDRLKSARLLAPTEPRAQAFVEEALRWLPGQPLAEYPIQNESATHSFIGASDSADKPLVLIADDNADMRDYLRRLLSDRYAVEAVADGQDALESARRRKPHLLLSDIMMPRLDGLGLLHAMRNDGDLRDVPVILLSARAGEEASVEGLEAGADDYLIKPFGARELLARVRANLEMAVQRREAENVTRRLNETLELQVAARTAELQAKEARLRTIFETSYTYLGLMSPDGTMLDANAISLAGINASLEDVVGKPFWETPWFTGTPGMPETVRAAIPIVASGEIVRQEIHVNLPAGGWRWFEFQMRPVRDANDTVVAIVPEAVEMTGRRQAEEALRQAQKMEAIGQLTGGIAHDFNNLLQVITGNLYLLQQRVEKGSYSDLRRLIERGILGAQRAATLTQRLLAFSRRQPLDPKSLDINRLVTGMSDLLQRSLGENISIQTVLSAGLWRSFADASELENALLNLAVNARDAMPEGGKLTIETANALVDDAYAAASNDEATPGQYVMIAVSDTGTGMSREVIAKAFEPFFTTKEAGQGTGLGLSQVYGFVKQSGGHVRIYSEANEGTTVRIYMPRLVEEPKESINQAARPPLFAGTREETILVVEDDADVRANTTTMLRELGYGVLEASDGPGALRIIESRSGIDLLFTDIGLPGGLNGRQLADKARVQRPRLGVLFTSGYARSAIVHQGRLDPGVELLSKPFTLAQLSAKIRQMLNRAEG
jgi:PAS domain S-box-containing protein